MDLWLIATAVLCVISHQMWGMLFYGILPTGTMFLDLAYPTKKSRRCARRILRPNSRRHWAHALQSHSDACLTAT